MSNKDKKYSLERYDSVQMLPLKYNAIFSQYRDDEIFLGRSWFELFESTVVDQDDRLCIYGLVLADAPDVVVMLLPLWEQQRFGGMVKILSSLGNYYTGHYEPLYAKNRVALNEVFSAFLSSLTATENWHLINLRLLTQNTLEYQGILTAIAKRNCMHQQYFICGNWYLEVKERDYEEVKSNRPGSLRSTLSRKGKKFAKMDGASIEILIGEQITKQKIEDYWSVYNKSWKSEETHKQLINNLIVDNVEGGESVLGLAYIKDKPIAAQIWIVGGKTAYIYKLAHLAEYDRLSVGTILLDSIMQYVHESYELDEIDFLTGDDKYKSQWMSGRREKWGIIMFNKRSVPGMISGCANIYGQKIKRMLLRSEKAA